MNRFIAGFLELAYSSGTFKIGIVYQGAFTLYHFRMRSRGRITGTPAFISSHLEKVSDILIFPTVSFLVPMLLSAL